MADVRTLSAYGLDQALIGVIPSPIVSKRNPKSTDIAPLGQMWINKSANTVYFLSSIVNKVATWATQASTVGALNVGGVITAGTGLVVTAGGATIGGNSAVTGSISATTTITAGTGLVATTGGVTATAGDVDVVAGNINMTAGQINLTGPVQVLTGAGVPAGGLALNVGDLYINTTAATTTTRLYIAVAAGTWAHFTASA